VVDEVGDGGIPPKLVVVGNGIQFVPTLPTAAPFRFPFIEFPRNDIPSPAGLAETMCSNIRGWTTVAPNCLAGRVVGRVRKWLTKTTSTRMGAPAQKTQRQRVRGQGRVVHVGRDLW
jgi:hypothetical protein